MKPIQTICLIAIFGIFLTGCVDNAQPKEVIEEEEVPEILPTEEAAQSTALDFVESMDEYLDKNGQDLFVTEVLEMACDGCYLVYLDFDKGKVKVILEDMKVVDSEYVDGDIVETIIEETEAEE
ncbi:hypothetical protein ACFL10_00935 [Patescibacteria group bacterium]